MKPQKPYKKEQLHKKPIGKIKENNPNSLNPLLPLLGMVAVTFVVFLPSLKNGFTNWDDPTYILDNPLIKQLSASNIKKIFTEVYFSNYQPLHIFSYALEYSLFKDQPYGYHVVSLLMHMINTCLVFWLAKTFTQNQFVALLAGLFFGIHPMHVESIAWAAERKDLLYAMFFFLSLIYYIKYIRQQEKPGMIYLAFAFFLLSVFSKAMAASLPPVLILVDFFFKRKINWKLVAEKIPFFLVAIIMGIISVNASKESGSIAANTDYTFFERFLFANSNLFGYFFKMVVPFNLSAYYPYPEKINGSLNWYYYSAPLFSVGLLFLCFYTLKKSRYIFFGIAFFVITIFLVLQLLPVGPAIFSERYSYVPSVGFILLLALAFNWLINTKFLKNMSMKYLCYVTIGLWSGWLCLATYQRCQVWKDSITLWTDVINQFDKALHAYNNRADAYYKNGNYDLTIRDLNVALSLNDKYAMAWYNRGNAYGQLGKFKEAFNDLDMTIKLDPANADAYNKRGQANAVLGNKDAAFKDFNEAVRLKPSNPEIYYNIGITWINSGNKEEACKALTTACNMNYPPALKAYGEICK